MRYLPADNFPALSAGSGNRRSGGAVLAPAELATVDPHPVQNHGQAPGDRNDGPTYPAPLGHPQAPRFQPRPFTAVGKQYLCGLVEHRAHQGVTTFGHPAVIVGLAGLVMLWRQVDMRADRPRVGEALRLVDRRTVGQRNDRSDPGAVISRRHTGSLRTVSSSILCRTANCWRMTRPVCCSRASRVSVMRRAFSIAMTA